MRRAVGRGIAALAVASAVAALASLAPLSPATPSCAAAGSHRAGVLVQHADGSIVTRCVSLGSGTITGEQLLGQSGIAWSGQTFGGFGVAVCALDGEPARYSDCPGKDRYWAVFVSRGGAAWQLSAVGISSLSLRDGDLEGFRYVPAAGVAAAPALPAGVCPAAPAATGRAGLATAPANSSTATATATAATTAPSPTASGGVTPATPGPTGDSAATGAAAGATPSGSPAPAPPSGRSGPDAGLLAAALAGGALAGLAILRLVAVRRRGP